MALIRLRWGISTAIPNLTWSAANAGIGNQVSVLLGRGDGTFHPVVNYLSGIGPMAAVTADFNGDSRLDLVTTFLVEGEDDGWLTLLLGNGDGTFPTRTYIEPPTIYSKPGSLVVGDFNIDHRPDLAVKDSFNGFVTILLGKGDGTFTGSGSFKEAQTSSKILTATDSLTWWNHMATRSAFGWGGGMARSA